MGVEKNISGELEFVLESEKNEMHYSKSVEIFQVASLKSIRLKFETPNLGDQKSGIFANIFKIFILKRKLYSKRICNQSTHYGGPHVVTSHTGEATVGLGSVSALWQKILTKRVTSGERS